MNSFINIYGNKVILWCHSFKDPYLYIPFGIPLLSLSEIDFYPCINLPITNKYYDFFCYIEKDDWYSMTDNYNVINLYPNPSSGIVNIEFSDLNESYHLVVRNTIGQKILELNNLQEKSTVSLEAYEKGVYIFEIISQKNSSSFIVLKQ